MRKALLILSFLFFVLSFIFLKHYFSIFYFQNDLNKIVFNIEMQKNGDIYACFDKNCDLMTYENDVYFYKLNQQNPLFYKGKVSEIELISNKNTLLNIKKIDLFLGKNYEEIVIDKTKISEIDFLGEKKYNLSFLIQNNDKNILQKTGVYIEGLFYNWYFYLISYILIIIYFIKYKNRFNFKIKNFIYFILLLAFLLRLSHIDFVSLWNDELYVLTYISNMGQLNFKNIFSDPGNPPLFYILSNIWLHFFNENIFLIRLLPLLFGVFGVYSIYFILNKIFKNEKISLIAAFLAAVNIFLIYESNEIRSYAFSMILILFSAYCFYRLKEKFSNKNLILYFLLSACLINTHYYCILFVIANLFLGLFLFKEKRKEFLLCNIFSFMTFIPYFMMTFCSNSLNKDFNNWLSKPSFEILNNHIVFYFGNILFFIIIVLFCMFACTKLSKKEKDIFIYNIYVVCFVFIFAAIISFIVKPILFERYFCIFLPLLIINTSLILNIDFKTKFQSLIFLIIFLFSINAPKYENFNLFSNIDFATKYFIKDSINNEFDSYLIVPDRIEYMKYYKNIHLDNIIVIKDCAREDVDLMEKYLSKIDKKGNIILYLPEMCFNSKIKYSNKINIKKINTTIVPVYKIVIK